MVSGVALLFVLQGCLVTAAQSPQKPLLAVASPKHNVFLFHQNLTEIESITYNERKAGEWLAYSLKEHGYTVEKQWVDKDEGRFNIYAYPGSVRETQVLISSHYDTVIRYPPR